MPDPGGSLQERVDAVLEGRARQVIEAHGGGVLITATEDGHVSVDFKGRCGACPSAAVTMGSLVEPLIRQVEGVTRVTRHGRRVSVHAERRIAKMFGLDLDEECPATADPVALPFPTALPSAQGPDSQSQETA
jgi:Fe-S cluster biogenesis protein NfuA